MDGDRLKSKVRHVSFGTGVMTYPPGLVRQGCHPSTGSGFFSISLLRWGAHNLLNPIKLRAPPGIFQEEQFMSKNPWIVVEFTRSESSQPPLGDQLQEAINENLDRNYVLHSWQFVSTDSDGLLYETIIAIFRKHVD